MPGVFPDYKAPIVRNGADGRELATARWGMPSSSKALMDATKKRAEKLQAKGKPVDFKELLRMEPDGGTTNIRNVKSKHWTRWLGVENRCVVPFNSFSEFNKAEGGDIWFALDETRTLPRKVPTVGYLAANAEAADRPRRTALVQRLAELGWTEGRTVRIEYRWADGAAERAAEIAPDLVRLPVDVIVTSGDAFVLAVKKATKTIPIIFMSAGDPVGNGLIESLARPGGNVTGLSLELTETVGKRIEVLREIIPDMRRLAILFRVEEKRAIPELDAARRTARTLGLDTIEAGIRSGDDIAPAIDSLNGRADAIYVCLDPLVFTNAALINTLALAARLPVSHGVRESVLAGGLVSYGPDFPDLARRAAELVDKALRGAKPADIPVEQPTKFDLILNLKTARSLGLTIPATLLGRADEVIE
jgi:putative ABC transport system substrate-binding protein